MKPTKFCWCSNCMEMIKSNSTCRFCGNPFCDNCMNKDKLCPDCEEEVTQMEEDDEF